MKSLLMFSKPKLLMLRNQRADLVQTLMIFQWNMNESMQLLLITEKRAKNFDKVLGEWLSKAND